MQTEPVALDPLSDGQERQIELVDAQQLGHLVARELANREPDVGMALGEQRQRERQIDRTHRVHRADRHVAGVHAAERLELLFGGFELCQDPAGADHQQLAGVGQRDPARGPLNERQAQFLLDAPDLLRDGRLGDVHAGGRAGEASLLGERDERSELAQVHK